MIDSTAAGLVAGLLQEGLIDLLLGEQDLRQHS
jgi:hypothetical protein